MEKRNISIYWLIDKMITKKHTDNELNNIFNQAKAMHREEMRDLYLTHVTKAERLRKIFEKQFEELYNETFGGEK